MSDFLEIHVLGAPSIKLNSTPITKFSSRKAEALFFYLAVTGREQPREVLADLLWDERSQQRSSGNLRTLLTSLRQNVGSYVDITNQTATFSLEAPYTLDLKDLQSSLEASSRQWQKPEGLSPSDLAALEQGLANYRGDFLQGFSIYDARGFEEWATLERDRLRHQVIEALHYVVESHIKYKSYSAGMSQAARLLALDNLREEAHRQLMQLLSYTGQRKAALAQFDICQNLLKVELGVLPAPETLALYEKIKNGQLDPGLTPLPSAAASGISASHSSRRIPEGYEMRELIGEGTFGAIYRAYQPVVGRDVAIKVIRPEFANDADFIRRFETEAQIIAHLEHPHIVPLYDYWREPFGAFLVMRYFRGSLRSSIDNGPWTPQDAAELLDQIAAALTVAHRHEVIHRDIKPDNILLDGDYNAYLADFGIAKTPEVSEDTGKSHMALGTYSYMSPEQIYGERATAQSDIYSLGIVLYELLTGRHPFTTEDIAELRHLQIKLPLVHALNPELPVSLDEPIQRATAKVPADRYPDVRSLAIAFREAVQSMALTGAPSVSVRTIDDGNSLSIGEPTLVDLELQKIENPYKGLRAFQESDTANFFGRQALVDRLCSRMAENAQFSRFLAVVGPSGSGKSSVIKAGLVPALRHGSLPGSEKWFIVEMVPGAHPFEELELALLRIAANQPSSLLPQIRENERGLLRAARRVLPDETTLTLVIDQFEDVFTLVEDQEEVADFLDSLYAAVSEANSPLRIIIVLRADFYDKPLIHSHFSELLSYRTQIVAPLTAVELEQVIVEPAKRVGIVFEGGLVADIVAEVNEQPGMLPLLQYALTELFEQRQQHTLTLEAYYQTGGVSGALARRAQELYDEASAKDQETIRQVFLRLIAPGDGTEDLCRRHVPQTELLSVVDEQPFRRIIEAFSKYRLLTLDRDPITHRPTVEIAHEALIRSWDQLRAWIDDNRHALHLQRLIRIEALDWQGAGRDSDYLLVGARLSQFEILNIESNVALSREEQDFLTASIAAGEESKVKAEKQRQAEVDSAKRTAYLALEAQSAQNRAANRLRYLVGTLGIFLVVAITLLILIFRSAEETRVSLAEAESRRLASEATNLLQQGGNAELAALLSVAALQTNYTTEADSALQKASNFDYGTVLFHGHTAKVTDAAFSPDGKYLLTSSSDKTARLWDVQTGKELREYVGHTDGLTSAAFSPDGKYVLTGSSDKTARLWDAQTGKEIQQFIGHSGEVSSVAFSPDGKYVLTGSGDKTARLWDAQTGKEIQQFIGHTDRVSSVAFSPDGKTVLTGSSEPVTGSVDNTARLWDMATGKEIRQFVGHTSGVTAVTFSSDGKNIATASQDGTLRLWETASGQALRVFNGHKDYVNSVAFSKDGQYLLSGSLDYTARLWDVQTGQQIRLFTHTLQVNSVAFSPDDLFAITTSDDGTARLWDLHGNVTSRVCSGHSDWVQSAIFSPNGQTILTSSSDHTARLWDATTCTLIQQFIGHTDTVYTVAFSPNGQNILTGSNDTTARLWDIKSGKQISVFIGHTKGVNSVAFSPSGQQILTASSDDTVRLWDAATGVLIKKYQANDQVLAAAFSPNGQTIYAGGGDEMAVAWDTQSGQQTQKFEGHTDDVTWLAVSPNGKFLLTASADKTARLWDTSNGNLIRIFAGHTDTLWSVSFSADGKYALTASQDKTARLWDVATGTTLRIFSGQNDVLIDASFSPSGQYIVTSGQDNMARVWDIDYHQLVQYVCRRVLRDFTDEEKQHYYITGDVKTC